MDHALFQRVILPLGNWISCFMPYSVYKVFSKKNNGFYSGFTSIKPPERLRRHNSKHKAYTGTADDWAFVFLKQMETKKQALELEKKIKKRGTKRYLSDIASR